MAAERSRRVWPYVVAVVVGAGACFLGVSVWALRELAASFGGDERWTQTAVPLAKVGPLFDLKVPPPSPLRQRSRRFGFQDPVFEVALEYEPAAANAYLAAAGLSVERAVVPVDATNALELVRGLSPKDATLTAARLGGLTDALGGDGGYVALYRSGVVVEGAGTVWLVLSAFGT